MKPMLAATLEDASKIKFPVLVSPKLDGIRGVVVDGKLRSRSLKPIPNPHVSGLFSSDAFSGLDGELILGSPTAPDVYRVTNAACAAHDGTPDVWFHVFDNYTLSLPFEMRYERTYENLANMEFKNVRVLNHTKVEDVDALLEYEQKCLDSGYEGVIIRSMDGAYKFGRSTVREGGMLKLKRFVDGEAYVVDIEEEMENKNEAKRNALGRTERSTAKSGLVGKGRAGTLVVVDSKTGVQFRIGSGLTDEDGEFFWKHRKSIVKSGKHMVKYKSFPVGVKDLPRHPVYLGGREEWDL